MEVPGTTTDVSIIGSLLRQKRRRKFDGKRKKAKKLFRCVWFVIETKIAAMTQRLLNVWSTNLIEVLKGNFKNSKFQILEQAWLRPALKIVNVGKSGRDLISLCRTTLSGDLSSSVGMIVLC